MKRIVSSIAIVVGAAVISVSCAANKQVSAEQEQAVQRAIAAKDFEIEASTAIPMRGRSVPLTSFYSLAVKGDSVYSNLPYFGQAYNIPYGGGSGLIFDSTVKNYNVASGKRGANIITFQAQSPDGKVEYTVEIQSEGSASILVNSQNRQAIRFDGKLVAE